MRGNESETTERTWATSTPFPIPMRGNEVPWPVDWKDLARFRFPIPMRGNELSIRAGTAPGRPTFPIPMRGNETKLHAGRNTVGFPRFPIP